MVVNVILCGGSGTRLWPLSRTLMPKQFLKLFDGKSLFELTLERNLALCDSALIISNEAQYFSAKDAIDVVLESSADSKPPINFILESIGKNTAPAIALAALSLKPSDILLVTPSDHLIREETAYKKAIKTATELAKKGDLVTFGITPSYAESGFGYIEAEFAAGAKNAVNSTAKMAKTAKDSAKAESYLVKRFHEKPDVKTAQNFIKAGNYYWNSGMFCFTAKAFLDALNSHAKPIYETALNAYKNAKKDGDTTRILSEFMEKIPSDSIDYAIMEKAKNIKVVLLDAAWSDVGSFDALYNELPTDSDKNTKNANLIALDSKNNLVLSDEKRAICLIDINDSMVIDTGDALLVAKKGSGQKVKKVVEKIAHTELATTHLTTHRPWGSYTILEVAPGYKIKRIVVKPKARLSLQKHFHRNEHWIVVSGTASVEIDGVKSIVRPNESIYIKMGQTHRLANEGKIPVVLIEAQVGEYTGEDDIVRLQDDFKRS